MIKKYRSMAFILAMMLMAVTGLSSVPSMAETLNYVVNGDFQTDDDGDWKPDFWTVSDELNTYTWVNGDTAKVLQIKTSGAELAGTVSQTVTGTDGQSLPAGYYTLEAKILGDPSLINSVKLFIQDGPSGTMTGPELRSEINTSAMTTFRLENVPVVSGSCTIGVSIALKAEAAWTWALDLDDITLMKTGEINFAKNGGFETVNASWKPDGWQVSDGLTDYFWSDNANFRSGSQGFKAGWTQKAGGSPTGTVTQVVTPDAIGISTLPDGLYTLEVYARYTNSAKAGLASLRLFAENTGVEDVYSENFASTITYDGFSLITLDNIAVKGGSCTIGLEFTLNVYNGEILTLDDLSFYKTGDITSHPPSIESLEAVHITTSIGQMPTLPGMVKALMTNGKQKDVPVQWNPIPPEVYDHTESIGKTYTIEGKVEGTDLPALAHITLTYKNMDFNHNNSIDVGDLAMAAVYYQVSESHELWDEAKAYDINHDRVVDLLDLMILSQEIL